MTYEALEVHEVRAGHNRYIFGGVFAANDGFFAEINEQKDGRIRRIAHSRVLPSCEAAVAWLKGQDCFVRAA